MSVVHTDYSLHYSFTPCVGRVTLSARLLPRAMRCQRVHTAEVGAVPWASRCVQRRDQRDNPIVDLQLDGALREVRLVARSRVTVDVRAREFHRSAWLTSTRRRRLSWQRRSAESSPLVDDRIADLAKRWCGATTDVISSLRAVVERTSQLLTYDASASRPGRPLRHVLDNGRGACQDFAHVAVAVLRAAGVATFYVAGYAPPKDLGTGRTTLAGMHAWGAVVTPDGQWLQFDPTRGSFDCHHYVVVAIGNGYADTAPVVGDVDRPAATVRRASVAVSARPISATRCS